MVLRKRRPVCQVNRYWFVGLAGLLGVVLVGWSYPPEPEPGPQAPTAPEPMGGQATEARGQPLDEPLRLIAQAKKAYASVRDYTCTMVKQERIGGTLQAQHVMTMYVRSNPFSVYFKFHEPKDARGQEACYVAGRNGGKMRVRSPGVLGAVGFVSVDVNDPRARKTSNRAITDAGIGNLIARFENRWLAEQKLNKTQVKIAEYEYNKRRCYRVEAIHPQYIEGAFANYRSVLYFDKENHLPIRVEVYDWPRKGGDPNGDLLEVYSYVNLKLNPGVPDAMFNR